MVDIYYIVTKIFNCKKNNNSNFGELEVVKAIMSLKFSCSYHLSAYISDFF